MTDRTAASDFLLDAVESLALYQRSDGALLDPIFRDQTQYGTAYFGWCCAVLAERDPEPWRDRARSAMTAALDHTSRPELPAHASGFDRTTLGIASRGNHRDFTWPPILRVWQSLGSDTEVAKTLAGVEVEQSFKSRPPSNWAAVWMSGEWLRIEAGLSPTSRDQFDSWIDVFFESALDVDKGLFIERGLPNAYDLFTRMHLSDLLAAGYDGSHADRLRDFLTVGLRRSLALQLSDGSLASGYRSTAQTWTLGAQIAYFTTARLLQLGSDEERRLAGIAAWRTFDSMRRWQRPSGPYSPVQNLQPPERRIGYEGYTSDGHYSPLALGFLATAISRGFGDEAEVAAAELEARPAGGWAEAEPSWRAVSHRGRISAAVQAAADQVYDGSGIVDLTFGVGRRLQLTTSARHLTGGPWVNPGLAVAPAPFDRAVPLSSQRHTPTAPIELKAYGLGYRTTVDSSEDGPLSGVGYRLELELTESGIRVAEQLDGADRNLSLLVPFLVDDGGPGRTELQWLDRGAVLRLGTEELMVTVEAEVQRQTVIGDYQNRRGDCGVIRLDLAVPATVLRWSLESRSAG